ncbi:leucyl aminopeptidase [Chloroflexota bacterium]
MEIDVVTTDITGLKTGAVVIGIFEGAKKPSGELAVIDKALGGAVSGLIRRGEIKGKAGEVTFIHNLGKIAAAGMAVVGLGKKKEITGDKVRSAAAVACRYLTRKKVADIAVVTMAASSGGIPVEESALAISEGAILGVYAFHVHKTRDGNDHTELKKLTLAGVKKADVKKVEQACKRGRIIAEATNLARDMVNQPANYMTPTDMAKTAAKIAKENNLELTVLEKKDMQKLAMGALLGVAQGSCQPLKFIILKYKGKKTEGVDLAFVGKGITFDSGGISLKPSQNMEEMKDDMAGGAAVIAAIAAISRLKPRINVVSIVPAVENLPGGSALKPGDVLKAMNGKTIEIISTDAEGRLVLADALGYAGKLKAKCIIDVATLTGACITALGYITTGVMGNDQPLIDNVIAAGKEAGEYMWQLPMFEEYKEHNKSDIADIKNAGSRGASTITAGQFLAEFVTDVPWVHLDIAGTSNSSKEYGYTVKGATGVPVRSLVNLALALSRGSKLFE